jgi:hypothetical protein
MRFFASGSFMNHLPQAPENTIRAISNFFKNSLRYSQVKEHTTSINTSVTNLPSLSTSPSVPRANLPPLLL